MPSIILSDNGASSGSAGIKTTGAADGTLALQTTTSGGTATTAVTIDTSQNVGIGTSSPAQALEVLRASNPTLNITETSGSSTTKLAFLGATTAERGALSVNFSTAEMRLTAGSSGNTYFQTFYTNGSERARIDSSGNLLVGTTSAGFGVLGTMNSMTGRLAVKNTSNSSQLIAWNAAGTSGFYELISFSNNAGSAWVGSINRVNDNSVQYNTSSDYRLKENIEPMTGALSVVQALKPCTYTWKADGSDGQGFIAHELQEVVPDCVTGEKDAVDADGNPVYQGIDTSFLVATLTAAIQEQQALITSLTARIAALEGAQQ